MNISRAALPLMICFALFAVIIAPATLLAGPSGYTVYGTVSSQYGPELDDGRGPITYDFTASVDHDKWFFRLNPKRIPDQRHKPPGGGKLVVPDYLEASSDGTNFYFVDSTASSKTANPTITNAGQGLQGIGFVPYGMPDELICLWYTYASAPYSKTLQGTHIYPLQELPPASYSDKNFLQLAAWTLSTNQPSLPLTIVIKGSGHGATNAFFQVLATTNADGVSFPLTTRVEYYYYPEPTKRRLRKSVNITASSLLLTTPAISYVPKLPNPSLLTDARSWTKARAGANSTLATQWFDAGVPQKSDNK